MNTVEKQEKRATLTYLNEFVKIGNSMGTMSFDYTTEQVGIIAENAIGTIEKLTEENEKLLLIVNELKNN